MEYHHVQAHTRLDTALGPVVMAASARGLCGLWFEGQQHQPDPSAWPLDDAHPLLIQAAAQVNAYLAGEARSFELPLDLSPGTPFQQAVWQALRAIGHGHTQTYGEVAQRVGRPAATRAVGAAIGRNPISLVVPCHRVLGAGGGLTGYAGGVGRKLELLRLERGH
jgi:methylated-DNA-[protein]-cysteine S-methyltransferase